MNTAVIITKTEPEVKRKAQALDEEPSEYLKKTIKQALADRKKGKASPVFNTGKAVVKWLESQGI